jgi:hypothetical protein
MMNGWVHGMDWESYYGWRTVTLHATVGGVHGHMTITLLFDERDAYEINREEGRHVFARDRVYVTFYDKNGNFTLNTRMGVVYERHRVRFTCKAKGGSMMLAVKTNIHGVGEFQFIPNVRKLNKYVAKKKRLVNIWLENNDAVKSLGYEYDPMGYINTRVADDDLDVVLGTLNKLTMVYYVEDANTNEPLGPFADIAVKTDVNTIVNGKTVKEEKEAKV